MEALAGDRRRRAMRIHLPARWVGEGFPLCGPALSAAAEARGSGAIPVVRHQQVHLPRVRDGHARAHPPGSGLLQFTRRGGEPDQRGEQRCRAGGASFGTIRCEPQLFSDGDAGLQLELLADAVQPRRAGRGGHLAAHYAGHGAVKVSEELTKTGHADLAYRLLLNTAYPSWGYLVEHGATTMWERWNGDQMKNDPSMNSYNHYAYGAVAEQCGRLAAGVDASPLDAGFHTVVLHPVFDARLGSVAFDYDSPYGTIHSDWKVTGSTAVWHLILPRSE